MGRMQRNKGARGQREFANMLRDRDWSVDDTRTGKSCEDIIAVDPDGVTWSVEVKNTKIITPEHEQQARRQAKARGLPWMLANHLHNTRAWLIRRNDGYIGIWKDGKRDV